MKRILIIILLAVSTYATAQNVGSWSRWFDGRVLYTAHVLENGEIFFDATENMEQVYCFSLKKLDFGPGEYMLIPHNNTSDAPFRAQYGWRVQYIIQEGMYFLAVRNTYDEFVWTLTLTPDNLKKCLDQEKYAESLPLEDILDSYLMNTTYLSKIPKEKIREMVSLLESRPARSIIEQTNLSLMRSELKVTEAERRGKL